MKNRINTIIGLEDNTKYYIIKQANYNGKAYYLATRATKDLMNLTDDFAILCETIKDGKVYINQVKDAKLLDLLLKYLKLPEDDNQITNETK